MFKNTRIAKALKIATRELRSNYGEHGIYASPYKHRQYWARDSFIASIGACTLSDFDQVKKNLDTFIKFQRKDGHIPARIEENYHYLTVLGIQLKRKTLKALHKQSQPWATDVVDSNSWFIISAYNFINTSKDYKWLQVNTPFLKRAANWLIRKMDTKHLETEGLTANWSDCNFVEGNTLYNNVLTWKALVCMSELTQDHDKQKFENLANLTKEAINNLMWNDDEGYFIHYISQQDFKHKEFYTDGNLLAIWWGMSSPKQTLRIYQYMDGNMGSYKTPIVYPRLVWWDHILNSLIFPMYKTENTFTLWSCIYSLSKIYSNNFVQGLGALNNLATTIVKYNTCHEVLRPNGQPVDLWFYKSEKSMAWTSGMFIYACSIINDLKKDI